MKKLMISTTGLIAIIFVLLGVSYFNTRNEVLLTLFITAGTFLYHFLLRLITGTAVNAAIHNRIDFTKPYYQVKPWERKLYVRLGVRKWKGHLPTLEPELYNPKFHSWTEIAEACTQSELIHTIIAWLSLLPILAIPFLGGAAAFIIPSSVSALLDLSFVMVQRFNRDRIFRYKDIQRKKKMLS